MALTIPCESKRVVSIAEYIEYVRSIDLLSLDRLVESAPMLRALANDRTLVVQQINKEIESSFGASYLPSAQTVYLGGGQHFYVRAAVWPSSAAVAGGRLYQDKFAYNTAHDHNFSFLTTNYLGPGYETEIYEYDYGKVQGYVGESVDLRFLEKVKFTQGTVMLYRANRDVHIQYPPEELTVTLNLMISLPEVRDRDQFYFDTTRRTIVGYVADTEASKRASLMKLAGYLGNSTTMGLLEDLARRHPCRRTRLGALESLSQNQPARSAELWEWASGDPAPLVANAARRKLKALEPVA